MGRLPISCAEERVLRTGPEPTVVEMEEVSVEPREATVLSWCRRFPRCFLHLRMGKLLFDVEVAKVVAECLNSRMPRRRWAQDPELKILPQKSR